MINEAVFNRLFVSLSSFSNKVLLYGLIFTLLPIMVAGALILRNERISLLNETKRELNLITQTMTVEILSDIEELQHDAALIAKLPELQSDDDEAKRAFLNTHLNHHQRYGQLAIIDLDGQIQITGKSQEPINITHIDSFRQAAKGEQAWVIAPALFKDTLVLHMHTPIYSQNGDNREQIGVLGSPTPLGNFSRILETYGRDMPGSTFILGADNRILFHEDPEVREIRPDYSDILDRFELQISPAAFEIGEVVTTKNMIYEEGGEWFIASLNTVESLGWTIVARKRLAVVLNPLHQTQIIGLLSLAALATLSIFAALYVRHSVTKPIENLAAVASELEKGNYEGEIPNDANLVNEIALLIQAVSKMRTAVTDREQQLQSFSASLENQVVERTAELQKLNDHLENEVEEHKKTAADLEISRDAAEAANKSKDMFLARMSHELRTPLNAIIGYAELIQETESEQKNIHHAAVKDANSIQRAGYHLLAIVNHVLNYSKIQAGKVEVTKTEFYLDRLLASALLSVKPIAEKNRNRIKLNRPNYSGLIISDELKLRQILINLLSNAAKFTTDGLITVQISVEHSPDADPQKPFGCLIMKVTDTGIGIPESARHKLFEPFTQVDESFNRKNEGTGLGLTLTKSFTEMLHGTISMQSKHGVGTQFEIKIPVELEEVTLAGLPVVARI